MNVFEGLDWVNAIDFNELLGINDNGKIYIFSTIFFIIFNFFIFTELVNLNFLDFDPNSLPDELLEPIVHTRFLKNYF
jgi:prepilin signal peptidase PulO-like enzyme (type II secretory pathway)